MFYSLILNPKADEIEILKLNLVEIQQEIDLERSRAAAFEGLEAQVRYNDSTRYSGNGTEAPILNPHLFRDDVMKVAYGFELPLTMWQSSRIDSTEMSQVRQFQIEGRFEGGYHQIAQSLSEILQLPWVLEIKYLRLNMIEQVARGKRLLVADFQLLSIPESSMQEWQYGIQSSGGV